MASPFDLPLTHYDPAAFLRTARASLALVSHPDVATAWFQAGALERMTVGGIATHGLRPIDDILDHCERPEAAVARHLGIVEFYRAARLDKREDLDLDGHRRIVENNERKAAEGPGPVLERARRALEQLTWMLPAQSPRKRIFIPRQPPMGADLAMMVANRTVELTVYQDDLATSVGLPTPPIDPAAAAMAFSVLTSVTRKVSGDLAVMRVLARAERAMPEAMRAL